MTVSGSEIDRLKWELSRLRQRLEVIDAARASAVAEVRDAIGILEKRVDGLLVRDAVAADSEPELKPEPPKIRIVATPATGMTSSPAMPRPEAVATRNTGDTDPESGRETSFELRLGRVWLVRFGMVLLVTGLVFLGNHAYQNWIRELSAGVRLAALYAGSLILASAGIVAAGRENLRRFGEVLLGGGLAFFYWCTYAAHHVDRLRVVESPVLAAMLLTGAAGVVTGAAIWQRSRTTAMIGLLLASYSTVLQPLGWLSAASNLTLAVAGMALMRWMRWAGPGVTAMAGCYGGFAWWQLAGAAGGDVPVDVSALWFLPPVWAVLSLPGVAGVSRRFGTILGDRARAIFSTANNVAFFSLFSAVWIQQRGTSDYWTVPAVFGACLLGLGLHGRGREVTGDHHLAQGLSAVTLALVLKLDGYHLALALAGQALGLACAFRRYRGRAELGFSLLAGMGAAMLLLAESSAGAPWGGNPAAPLWSRGLVALVLAAAVLVFRTAGSGPESDERGEELAGIASVLLLGASTATGLFCWCLQVPTPFRGVVAGGVALSLGPVIAWFRSRKGFDELGFAALAFAVTALAVTALPVVVVPAWSPLLAACAALAGHAWWERKGSGVLQGSAISWVQGATVGAGLGVAIWNGVDMEETRCVALVGAAVGLAAAGRWLLVLPRLTTVAALMIPGALAAAVGAGGPDAGWVDVFPVIGALAVLGIAAGGMGKGEEGKGAATRIARAVATLGWISAWRDQDIGVLAEVFAGTAIVLILTGGRLSGRRFLPEAVVFLALGTLALGLVLAREPWRMSDGEGMPHGVLAVAVWFVAGFRSRIGISRSLLYSACGLLTLWSSLWVIRTAGENGMVVLWAGLALCLVTSGLWCRRAALRQSGFALFGLAVLKLFIVDVWDFAAFARVTAFLALGVAMVAAGFLYNRFSEWVRRLLEDER